MPRYRARDIFTKFSLVRQGLSHARWYWKLVANVYLVTGQSDQFFPLRHILSEEDPTMGHVLQFRSFRPATMPWIIQDRHDFQIFSTLYGWTNKCDEQIAISCLQSNRFIKTVSAKIASDFDELDLLRSDPLDNFALLYTIVECSRGRDPHFSATSHTSSHKKRFAFYTSWDLLQHKISEYWLHWQEPSAPRFLRTEQKLLK